MESQKERDLLRKRFQQKKNDGLVDMKFFLGQVSEQTVDDVCEEVNRLYKLVEEGKCKVVTSWGDGKGTHPVP